MIKEREENLPSNEKYNSLQASAEVRNALRASNPFFALHYGLDSLINHTPQQYKEHLKVETKNIILEKHGKNEIFDLFVNGKKEGSQRKLAILALGEVQATCIQAGALLAMQDMGILQNADALFGTSAGAGNITAWATGQSEKLSKIYWEDNCEEGNLVNLPNNKILRIPSYLNALRYGPKKPIINTPFLTEVFTKRKPLDLDKLQQNPKEIYGFVLNAQTAELEMIDMKKRDAALRIEAASTPPGITPKPWVEIDGKKYIDAGFSDNSVPLRQIFDLQDKNGKKYTDVLIIDNNNFDQHQVGWFELGLLAYIGKHYYGYN